MNTEKELLAKYTDPQFKASFVKCFTVSTILRNIVYTEKFNLTDKFGKAIILTKYAEDLILKAEKSFDKLNNNFLKLAFLINLYHEELYIDVKKSDINKLIKIINQKLLNGELKLPWVFDRFLHDKYNSTFKEKKEYLNYEETLFLLKDSPDGVFQLGKYLIGPFGLLESVSSREFEPTNRIPCIIFCKDPSCGSVHSICLTNFTEQIIEPHQLINSEAKKYKGDIAEWEKYYSEINVRNNYNYYDDTVLDHFPWLIANSFSENELKILLKRIIDKFPEIRKESPKLKGPSEKIVNSLNKSQCFNLIFLISDKDIIKELEYLISYDLISIPSTEIRTPKYAFGSGGWFSLTCECSRFGFRTITRKTDLALPRLKRLIKEIYKDQLEQQLEWKLRNVEGNNLQSKLDNYLQLIDPREIIKDLIFINYEYVEKVFELLNYGLFEKPSSEAEEKFLIDKILWKLGFNIPLYPNNQSVFWDYLSKFSQISKTNKNYTEENREDIRSAGVNFFVALEDILDISLSFTTWMLFSDHFFNTRFKYNLEEGRVLMASILNGKSNNNSEPISFDPAGKNTLYPLSQGFLLLKNYCDDVLQEGDKKYLHNKDSLPSYYGKTEIETFPFLHKILLFDLMFSEFEKLAELLEEITSVLNSIDVCGIRNKIDHKREIFPTQPEIENMCDKLSSIIKKMEEFGINPLVYYYNGSDADFYSRRRINFKNYKNKNIIINQSAQHNLAEIINSKFPQIIVLGLHLGITNETLRFQFEETSDYSKLWKNYPKR